MTDEELTAEIEQADLDNARARAEGMTDNEAAAWLQELDGRLWRPNPRHFPGATGSAAFEQPRKPNKASLSREDWEIFKVLALRFPSVPHNAWLQFGFGLTVCTFPVAPGAPVKRICTVNTDHMGEMLEELRQEIDMPRPGQGDDFRIGWELFSPLSHTDQNREWHELYGLGGLHPRYEYDY